MWYGFLADLIVAFHFLYVGFVVAGQLLICVGVVLRWRWVRNPWFRLAHLLAIAVVAFEAVAGLDCPLTTWEAELRGLAGQEAAQGSFLGRYLHSLIFYNADPAFLNLCHIGFAALVIATFLLAPPWWRRARHTCGSTVC
jgi:Protein of Unknown function (DUF2784)